jgi:hypothetical protein
MIAKTGGDNPSQNRSQALTEGCTEGEVPEFTLAPKWGIKRGYKGLAGYDMKLKTQPSRYLRGHQGPNVIRTDEQQGAYDVAEHPEGKGTLYADPVRKPADGDAEEEREQKTIRVRSLLRLIQLHGFLPGVIYRWQSEYTA